MLTARLFHACLDFVTQPLKKAAEIPRPNEMKDSVLCWGGPYVPVKTRRIAVMATSNKTQ